MKKYLFSALALPLLFACSDEFNEKQVASNDPFPGIQKVNASFYMDEEDPITRMDNGTGWTLAKGDWYGFAWMGDGQVVATNQGKAFQNHNLIQQDGRFEPQTSIYVGKYFIYRPYDFETVSPEPIKFTSLVDQPLIPGFESTTDAWKKLAEKAIIIADKWTNIAPNGRTYKNEDGTEDNTIWDQPGIKKPYKVFAAFFSNQTGLDLTYLNNNPKFAADQEVWGATDIDINFAKGESAGATDIYSVEVALDGAANSFSYGPTKEPNEAEYPQEVVENGKTKTVYHNAAFWANKKNLGADDGFVFNIAGPQQEEPVEPVEVKPTITLTPDKPINTGEEGKGHDAWFWFNSLPVTNGEGTLATEVETKLSTSYGLVTVTKTLGDCAYEWGNIPGTNKKDWRRLVNENPTSNPYNLVLNGAGVTTFVNHYGNHKGRLDFTVDFSKADMSVVHINDDEHLQKLLKYYLASGKTDAAVLPLDGDDDGVFKLSKISIALLQTINRAAAADPDHRGTVKVKACGEHETVKIIITQEGQNLPEYAEFDLENATEVPTLNDVFAEPTAVYLSSEYEWTWSGDYTQKDEKAQNNQALTIDANVESLTNEGTITVNAINVQLNAALDGAATAQPTIYNAKDATMNITKVTTVKSTLNNLGTINVGSDSEEGKKAELRAYGIDITNDAKTMLSPDDIINKREPTGEEDEVGIIHNWGVVGVSDGTVGRFFNYGGMIIMEDDAAMTFLTSNELIAGDATSAFSSAFNRDNNKMGVVVLPDDPYAIVSVANKAENGFITYDWTKPTYEHDPGNVKYNTIVVSGDITFQGDERASEIQFIMFKSNKTKVVNPGVPTTASRLNNLKGVIVPEGKSFILEKTNRLRCLVGAYVGKGAAIYKGGEIVLPENSTSNYFGDWTLDQIVKW